MFKRLFVAAALMLGLGSAPAQVSHTVPTIDIVNTLPAGACTSVNNYQNYQGTLYTCYANAWTQVKANDPGAALLAGAAFTGGVTAPSMNFQFLASTFASFSATLAACQNSTLGCTINLAHTTYDLGVVDCGATIPCTIIGAPGETYHVEGIVGRGAMTLEGTAAGGGISGANPHTIFQCDTGVQNCFTVPQTDNTALMNMKLLNFELRGDGVTAHANGIYIDLARLNITNIGFGGDIDGVTVDNFLGCAFYGSNPGNRPGGVMQYFNINNSTFERSKGGDCSMALLGAGGQISITGNSAMDTGSGFEYDRGGIYNGYNLIIGTNGSTQNVTFVSGTVNAPTTNFPSGSVTFSEIDSPVPLSANTIWVQGCTQNLAPLNGARIVLAGAVETSESNGIFKYTTGASEAGLNVSLPATGAFSEGSSCGGRDDSSWATTYDGAPNMTVSNCSISGTVGTCGYTASFPLASGNIVALANINSSDPCYATLNGQQVHLTSLSQTGSNGSYSGSFGFTWPAADCAGNSTGQGWVFMNEVIYSTDISGSCQYGGGCAILDGVDGLTTLLHQEGQALRNYTQTMSITNGSSGVATITGSFGSTFDNNASNGVWFSCTGWTNAANNVIGEVVGSNSNGTQVTVTIPGAIAETSTPNVNCVVPSTNGIVAELGASQNGAITLGGRVVGTVASGPGTALFDFLGTNNKAELCFSAQDYYIHNAIYIGPSATSTQSFCDGQLSTSSTTVIPYTQNLVPIMGYATAGVYGATTTFQGASYGIYSASTSGTLITTGQGQQLPGHPYFFHSASSGGQIFEGTASLYMQGGNNFTPTCSILTGAIYQCSLATIYNEMPAGGGSYTITMGGSGSLQWVSGITRSGGTYSAGPPLPIILYNPCTVPLVITEFPGLTAYSGGTGCSATPVAVPTPGPIFSAKNFADTCIVFNGLQMPLLSATSTSMTFLTYAADPAGPTCASGGQHATNLFLVTNFSMPAGLNSFTMGSNDTAGWVYDDSTYLYDMLLPQNINKYVGTKSYWDADGDFDHNGWSFPYEDTLGGPAANVGEVCQRGQQTTGSEGSWYWVKMCASKSGSHGWLGFSTADAGNTPGTWAFGGAFSNGVFNINSLQIGSSPLMTGVQGAGTVLLAAGTVAAGAGNPLCTDGNGNATTSGCPGFVPTFSQVTGDLACAVANDSTIDPASVTGGTSTSTTITYTFSSLPNVYQVVGQSINLLGTGGANSTLGTPFTVTSFTTTSVTITNSSNPGTFGSGGTISLACGNTTNDALSATPYTFLNTYTTPAGMVSNGSYQKFVAKTGTFSPSASPASISNTGLRLVYGAKNIYENESSAALSANGVGQGGVLIWSLLGLTTTSGYGDLDSTSVYSGAALGSWSNIIISPTPGLPTAASTVGATIYFTATGVASGTYTSGITAVGTVGQTCTLTSFNDSSTATATVALTGTNTIAPTTALVITSRGAAATAAPTSATAGNGTATCSGTAVLSTVLGGSPGNALLMRAFGRTQ